MGTSQVECCAFKTEFSLTFNQIDLNQALDWYGGAGELPLQWKENGVAVMTSSLGWPIQDINLLTYVFRGEKRSAASEQFFHGLEFVLVLRIRNLVLSETKYLISNS